MSDERCAEVRLALPEWVRAGGDGHSTAELARHVAECAGCSAEAELLRLLVVGRPVVPEGLTERIRASVAAPARGAPAGRRPWWGLAAAAVAAVALGVGTLSDREGVPAEVPAYVTELAGNDPWLSGDGEIAGAPALDDLSDAALEALLEELASGGAA